MDFRPSRKASYPSYENALGNKAGLLSWDSSQLASTIPKVFCPYCSAASPAPATSPGGLTHQDSRRGLSGLVAQLGMKGKIPYTSVIRNGSQPSVNDGTFNHPVIPLWQSPCGHLVWCAQVTSFSGGGIQAKYAGARSKEALWKYAPIKHQDGETHDPTIQPGEIETDRDLMKPSYMNLNSGYWIEWQYLRQFKQTADGKQARLSADSLHYATWAYAAAEKHRQTYGDDFQEKLAARSWSPPQSRSWCIPSPPLWTPQASPQMPFSFPAVVPTAPLSAAAPSFAPGVGAWRPDLRQTQSAPELRAPSTFNPMASEWRP